MTTDQWVKVTTQDAEDYIFVNNFDNFLAFCSEIMGADQVFTRKQECESWLKSECECVILHLDTVQGNDGTLYVNIEAFTEKMFSGSLEFYG